MTLTKVQDHRSRSNVQKLAKIYKMGHISDAISLTDFILGTKVQPNKTHSMIQVPMTLTLGHRSRLNFSKMGKKTKKLAISWMLFHLQTSYLVPRYNPIRRIQ